jgi:hypothetical protein
MKRGQPLGVDELMIVNPGPSSSGAFLLGEDGTLYRVQGLDQGEERTELGQFFLGEDGTVYQARGRGEDESSGLGRFFLGEGGTLYEVV